MPVETVPADLLPVTWQLAAAFGQGAGTMIISADAAAAVMQQYRDGLERNAKSDATMLQLITFIRALGAAAAGHALRRGSAVIEPEDVLHVIGRLNPNQARPLGLCPICL